jgi:hypothetical protein
MTDGDDRSGTLAPVAHLRDVELGADAAWRDAVRARISELGIRQADLGSWIGCAQSQISYLLSPEGRPIRRSIYVERISVALGIELPAAARIELAATSLAEAGDRDALELLARNAVAFSRKPTR